MTINIRMNHKKHKLFAQAAVFTILVLTSASAVLMVLSCFVKEVPSAKLMIFLVSAVSLLTFYFTAQFVLISDALAQRFQSLHACVKGPSQLQSIKFVRAHCFKIDKAVNLFTQLSGGIEIANETFTYHFILLFPLNLVS
jgi:hypothetical protein